LKSSSKARASSAESPAGQVFLFPGPEGWEAWSRTSDNQIQCVGPVERPAKLRAPPGAVFCLPCRTFFSVPIWVREVEGSPSREQVGFRLEEKGVLGPSPENSVWGAESIRSESLPAADGGGAETRQLQATAILLPGFPDDWLVESAGPHEVAGRTLPPPRGGSGAVLRRELGRWILDLYVQGKWLHSQPLLARNLNGDAAVELVALLAQLEAENLIGDLPLLLIRDEKESAAENGFISQMPFPCRTEPRMPPQAPVHPWNLQPPALVEHRQAQVAAAKRKKTIRFALGAYALALLLAVAFLFYPLVWIQIHSRALGEIRDEAGRIKNVALTWQEAAFLLDPKKNALELLWQVSRPLISPDPPTMEGVQLTTFSLNGRRLLLQGKATDLVKVQAYLDWLKNNPELVGLTWKNSQPRLAADGTATFQAEAVLPMPVGKEGETEEIKDEGSSG